MNKDTGRTVVADAVALPRHSPASVVEPDDAWIALRVAGRCVDAELGPDLVAGVVEALCVDTCPRQVLLFGLPHNDEATVLQRGDGRRVLRAGGV